VKGSPFRKRYIVVYSSSMDGLKNRLESDLFSMFHAKRKYLDGPYAIFLTDQFKKKRVIEFINSKNRDVSTLITSGTILKCKKFITAHSQKTMQQDH